MALTSFCRETPFRPGGPEESSPGREPGVKDQRVRRALKGRHKIQRAQSVVPPLPGSTLGFHPTPGLRPGLFSVASSRLQTLPNRVSRQKPARCFRSESEAFQSRFRPFWIRHQSLSHCINSPAFCGVSASAERRKTGSVPENRSSAQLSFSRYSFVPSTCETLTTR
jgi:hypothetical protein